MLLQVVQILLKLMKMTKPLIYILLFCLLFVSSVNANKTYQSHDKIFATVQNYLDKHITSSQDVEIKTKIGHLDSRLKLSPCENPLKSFSNNHNGFGSKISVGIKCEGVKPWSLYVPVKIQRLATVFVSAQPIAKGDQIVNTDIQQVSMDISKLRGSYAKSKAEIIGKIPKRSIPLGSVFNPRYLRLPIMIKKGDLVDIVAESQGLRIRMQGQAINDGAKGQRINVKNLSSNRTIQAIVKNSGLVKIHM